MVERFKISNRIIIDTYIGFGFFNSSTYKKIVEDVDYDIDPILRPDPKINVVITNKNTIGIPEQLKFGYRTGDSVSLGVANYGNLNKINLKASIGFVVQWNYNELFELQGG